MAESIQRFVESRRSRWEDLERLLHLLEQGKTHDLRAGADLLQIGRLYREATADLARIQAHRPDGAPSDDLEIYLNHLVARAHGQIYRSPAPGWSRIWGFLRVTFPRTFRRTAKWTLLATGIFALGSLFGFGVTTLDDSFAPLIVSPAILRMVEEGRVWFDSILAIRPLASSMIMTNNISVTFTAFAFGIFCGLGTVYVLAFNGLMVGTLAALCHIHGLDVPFWSFVLPHGVIELTAIWIAGGAGLLLGSGLVAPGDLPRRDSLVRRGRRSIELILGCIPLLVVAGAVEGFVSPSHVPAALKFVVAGILLLLLLFYLLSPAVQGRGSGDRRDTPA
jgi:uncharacterized membrane protein SpoIIM required for sporulation